MTERAEKTVKKKTHTSPSGSPGARFVITIDGPAGAGKTTVSRIVARRLACRYVDTGALYRGVAREACRAGVRGDDDMGLEKLCKHLSFQFVQTENGQRLLSNGIDITNEIRSPEITMQASALSARPVVRACLLEYQREMAKCGMVLFEGRDMGTVVFPDADIKFFLDGSEKIRALRRYRQLQQEHREARGRQSLAQVEADMKRRDRNDRTRSICPLKPAVDAILIDSSNLPIEEVVQCILSHIAAMTKKLE
jgi:cytidylate kinase